MLTASWPASFGSALIGILGSGHCSNRLDKSVLYPDILISRICWLRCESDRVRLVQVLQAENSAT